jgi:hypothetical protein
MLTAGRPRAIVTATINSRIASTVTVNLLTSDEIPYFTVGSHRRVLYKDLLKFRAKRDAKREEAPQRTGSRSRRRRVVFPDIKIAVC